MATEIINNWPYLLISLVIGILIGALTMRFASPRLRKQKHLQKELEATKVELEQHRQELVRHFAHSAELLDNMAQDFRNLYQHMAKNSSVLLPDMIDKDNPFHYKPKQLKDELDENELPIVDAQPRDYSDKSSGLLKNDNKD